MFLNLANILVHAEPQQLFLLPGTGIGDRRIFQNLFHTNQDRGERDIGIESCDIERDKKSVGRRVNELNLMDQFIGVFH